MYLYDRNMVTNINLKYANSSSNYYVIMMLQNLKKIKKFPIFDFEANNNREAVVVCARHVVKRPSKRNAPVVIITNQILINRSMSIQ